VEVYLAPGDDSPEEPLTRSRLLQLMQTRGLEVVPDHLEQHLPTGVTLWTLRIAGDDLRITFQERQGLLVFATIEHSMFGDSELPDRLCEALESLGWQADNENVG
jgi:hypothetical protein